jgi:hypothetical protein
VDQINDNYGVSTGSGPGSPGGQPAWGGGCDQVSINASVESAMRTTRSLALPVLTSLGIRLDTSPKKHQLVTAPSGLSENRPQ